MSITHSSSFLDRHKVEAAYVVFSTVFDMRLSQVPVIYPQIAMRIDGVAEKLELKWLGENPTMRKWTGDRTISRLRGESQTLTTEWWANGIEVDADDLRVDGGRFGMIQKRIASLAAMASRRIDAEVMGCYLDGFTGVRGLTYDGQYAFDTDHTASGAGGVSQSNLVTGALSSVTFNQALERAMKFVDENGEPIYSNPRTLMVGPANQLAARELLTLGRGSGGADNINFGQAEPIITSRITDNKWFLLSAEEELRMVILGVSVDPQFVAADDPSSFEMFSRRNALYGAHVKFGTCYGMWQASVGSLGV